VSNPDREQKFEANGKTYTLVFGNRALRLSERETGKNFSDLDLSSIEVQTTLVWAGLQKHHPDLKIDDIDDIMDDVGYLEMADVITKAIQASFPAAEETPEGNENRAQRRAQVGAGATSSSKA